MTDQTRHSDSSDAVSEISKSSIASVSLAASSSVSRASRSAAAGSIVGALDQTIAGLGQSIDGICAEVVALRASNAALVEALTNLIPLAEFGAGEQSPPYHDGHLIDAARAAIAAAKGQQS